MHWYIKMSWCTGVAAWLRVLVCVGDSCYCVLLGDDRCWYVCVIGCVSVDACVFVLVLWCIVALIFFGVLMLVADCWYIMLMVVTVCWLVLIYVDGCCWVLGLVCIGTGVAAWVCWSISSVCVCVCVGICCCVVLDVDRCTNTHHQHLSTSSNTQ